MYLRELVKKVFECRELPPCPATDPVVEGDEVIGKLPDLLCRFYVLYDAALKDREKFLNQFQTLLQNFEIDIDAGRPPIKGQMAKLREIDSGFAELQSAVDLLSRLLLIFIRRHFELHDQDMIALRSDWQVVKKAEKDSSSCAGREHPIFWLM